MQIKFALRASIAASLLMAFSASAIAATITVNTLVDENNTGTSCSLREAITAANSNAAFGGCSAGSGPDTLNITVNGTINLTAALPNITSSMTISGNGANLLTVRRDTGGNYRIFHIPNGGLSVEFAGITIANGNETGGSASGGGIRSVSNLTLTNVHMTGNSASSGSALAVENATGLIIGSTFSANAGFNGVIETNITDGFTYVHRMRNSTISGNSTGRDTIVNRAFGTPSESTLVLENCTVVGNTAPAGSAIHSNANGASVVASTRLLNTIVAGNTPSNLSSEALEGGVADIRTNGFNLSDNFNGAFTPASTDIVAANPGLGPLALYGGPTPTHALLAGSPALDKGSFAGAAISTDQRGLPRPIDIPSITAASGGNNSDIGAYELQAIEVTNTNDAGGGSLRAAIATAASNGPSVDEIVFSAVFNTPRTITLTTGELFIGSNVNVLGPGANLLSVSGNNASRVFQVGPGATVTLSGMTITGGNTGGDGGGIYNDGTLTVSQVNIIGNRSAFNGGGIGTGNGDSVTVNYSTIARNTAQNSGAILSNGSLTILRSTISGNTALAGAGAILVQNSGSLNMQNATITANRVTTAGGISGLRIFSGSASIGNSIIAANIDNGSNPDVGGTGIISECRNRIGNPGALTAFACLSDFVGTSTQPLDPRLAPLSNYGGPTLTHALLGDSQALDAGGNSSLDQRGLPLFDLAGVSFGGNESDIGAFEAQAILVTNANDANTGSLRSAVLAAAARPGIDDILFGSESNALFNNPQTIVLSTDQILLDSDLNLVGPGANLLTVSGDNGRRVFDVLSNRSVSLVGMRITGGSADNGAGIRNAGRLTVSHATINGNTASNFGGGIFGPGGAVTTVASSTLSGNTANAVGGTAGAIDHSGDLTVSDSTISGNNAPNGNTNGGGLWIGGVGQIANSTITNNTTVGATSASGVFVNGASPVSMRNSIVAGNTSNATLPDVLGSGIASRGFNLIGNRGAVSFAATGDQSGTGAALLNPLLGVLQNNGGTTATHAMLAGSPALDKGDRSGTTVDQRGAARPSDFAGIANTSDGSDIGAFEAQGTTDPIPTASASAPNVSTPGLAPVSYQVTVVYADDTAINVSTINTSDIVVTGPNAYSATPVLVSAPGSNGTPRTAFYTLNAPGGAWAVGNNGNYTISMRANEVSDSAGSFVPPGPIGSFTVNIVPVAPTVNYSPAAGSTINFPAGPAGNADSSINIQSSGGVAPGSVTIDGIAPSVGFTFPGSPPPYNGTPSLPILATLTLRCIRGASAQTATLVLTETPNPGSVVQRSWTLNCPAAVLADVVFQNGFE